MSTVGLDAKLRLKILRILMKPIVRFSVRHRHTIQEFNSVCKYLYIEAAQNELEGRSKKFNVSRISVMTGLYRDEITRILNQEQQDPPEKVDTVGKVLEFWLQNARFSTKSGEPRVLSYGSADSDFTKLCEQVSTNVHPASILHELERLGIVEKTARGLKRIKRMHSTVNDPMKTYSNLGRELEAHLNVVEGNIERKGSPACPHIFTEYDNIYADRLPAIRKWLWSEYNAFHRKLRKFLSKHDRDITPRRDADLKAGQKVIVGSFAEL